MSKYTPNMTWVSPLHPCGSDDNPNARLIGHVRILGADFHVNAEQVEDSEEVVEVSQGRKITGTIQRAVIKPESDTYVPEISALVDGAGETVSIDGRDYLLVISPFQR